MVKWNLRLLLSSRLDLDYALRRRQRFKWMTADYLRLLPRRRHFVPRVEQVFIFMQRTLFRAWRAKPVLLLMKVFCC